MDRDREKDRNTDRDRDMVNEIFDCFNNVAQEKTTQSLLLQL
jgi:hypothetical protein